MRFLPFPLKYGTKSAPPEAPVPLPVLALFFRISPSELLEALLSDVALDALWVSLKTGLIAHFFVLLVGTPAAYFLATKRFRGRGVLITLVELPLVLPPAVARTRVTRALQPTRAPRPGLDALGIHIPLTQTAVVLAVTFVAAPFYVRQAIASFETVDRTLIDASRTLGASPARTFWRIAVPLSATGLGAGSALAWARGTGEFGATIMFAGSLQGVTQTMPLAIYAQLDLDPDIAIAIGALLVLVSLTVLLSVKLLPSWTRFTSISYINSARSGSS